MRHIFLPLLVGALLSACTAIETRSRENAFDANTASYARAIRWAEYEAADKMRRLPGTQPARTQPSEDIRVTAYETISATPGADENEVNLTVRISYYSTDMMKIKSLTDRQTWKYDTEEQRWYITTALPAFK